MPAANSIHCQSVLERSVLFNAYRLPSKLITVGWFLDLQLEDVKDIQWEICRPDNHILKFILEPQRCEKEGFGDCGRVLADETGKDLPLSVCKGIPIHQYCDWNYLALLLRV
jgi:hypothetical protein